MQRLRSLLALIIFLVIAAIAVAILIPVPQGLDLRGGSQLTIQKKYLDALRLFKCTPEELAAASEKSINQRHKRKPGRPKRFPQQQATQVSDRPAAI